jgi:flagellar biosynthetic protein FliQ
VPKLCAAVLALVVAGPWIGGQITRFAVQLFLVLPDIAS